VGLRHLGKGQKVLHPGPINRGVEIEAELADSGENLILQQVEAGLAVRMAIMYRLMVDTTVAAEEAADTAGAAGDRAADVKNIRAVG
jgi:aspartate carbamoyltransferase catalytic subunit